MVIFQLDSNSLIGMMCLYKYCTHHSLNSKVSLVFNKINFVTQTKNQEHDWDDLGVFVFNKKILIELIYM